MDSNEIGTEELKYLWLLKKVAARALLLLLSVYEYAKENSGDYKTRVVSTETAVVFIFGPLNPVLKGLAEKVIEFVDDQIDKYAPSQAKDFVVKSQSLIYKTKPFVKTLVTTTQTITSPLFTTTIFILKITRYFIQSITPKPAPLFGQDQTPEQKSLTDQVADTAKSIIGGLPLVGNVAESLTTNPADLAKQIVNTTNSLVKENPVLNAVNSAAQDSLDAAKSLVGGLPVVGNVAESLTTNPTDLANQIANTTSSLVKENPILDAVNSAAQSSLDATKSLVGGLPLMGNVAESLTTNPADLANQVANTTNSLLKENPLLNAVNSAAQTSLDTTNSLVGGIPVVGDVAQSLTTNPTDLANQVANTTNSLLKENPLLNAVNSAAQTSLDTTNSLVGGIPVVDVVAQSNPADLANQIADTTSSLLKENPLLNAVNSAAQTGLDTTNSLVGGIPVVGDVAQSLTTNPTDLTNQVANTTNSLLKENPLLNTVNLTVQTSLDTTNSLVGGIPVVGDVAQSLTTNQAGLANQILNTTNSLVNANPLFGAINSAAENIGTKATLPLKLPGIPWKG